LEYAEQSGIATETLSHTAFADRAQFDRAMHEALVKHGAEMLCMAGFMRLLSPWFTETWHNKLINIHPSLLPAFKGLDAQQQALDAGATTAGCTVHFVRPEMDSGPIIVQASVPVLPEDDAASLSARILEQEHRIYPLALKWIAEGKVQVKGEKTVYADVKGDVESNMIIPAKA